MNFLPLLLCATLTGAISPHVVLVIIDDYVSCFFESQDIKTILIDVT